MNEFELYIKESAGKLKEKLDLLCREDSLVFPLFTDLHTIDNESEYSLKLFKALDILCSTIECSGVINLGDNFAMLGREIQITNSELKNRIVKLLDKVYEICGCPVINVHGNHDGIGTDFFKPDFWNECVKGKYGIENAIYGNGSYYCVDFNVSDTRLVVLSLPHDSDLEAENPAPLWNFGKEQIEWVRDVALDTDKKIILLCHAPLYYEYQGKYGDKMYKVWNGEKVCETHVSNLCGWIDDVETMSEVIKNFDKSNPGKLVVCLSGHTHTDSVWQPMEEKNTYKNPLPCVQLVTSGVCRNEYSESQCGFCMDVIVWTPSQNKLALLRLGDGKDRIMEFGDK